MTTVVGPFVGSLDNYADGATILHGELDGLFVSALLACCRVENATIHSDHLNAIRVINSSLVTPIPPHS